MPGMKVLVSHQQIRGARWQQAGSDKGGHPSHVINPRYNKSIDIQQIKSRPDTIIVLLQFMADTIRLWQEYDSV